ncbi:hypothetical protein [Massilia pseudoviolaceinigra]|uniref:hypothetical protein n=1 Tax=Massilia pseudoviolaceinigra TaxID=3057165 RepID=UPI0027969F22|nr:hypothetical protein [Massilia sp. CCM 9206]MDQ1920940.1 hypothetical protein [Massilia sp. CCM 9206]
MTNRILTFPVLLCVLLAACGKSPSPTPATTSTDAPAASTSAASGESWEVVLLERDDPPNQLIRMMHDAAYLPCVEVARLLKVSVKPFPVVPDNYGHRRVTRITNGTSSVVKTESLGGEDASSMDPKTGCVYTLPSEKMVSVSVTHAGKATRIEDGKVTSVDEIPEWPAHAPRGKDTTEYTQARTVNGVELRCLPPNFWTMNTNKYLDLREMCVYKTDKVLVDESGDPLILLSHAYANVVNPKYAYTAIVEPLSLRRIPKSEKDPYQVGNWGK